MRRLIRAVKLLARDGRVPKWLRGLAAFGLLPIPGPVDELALLLVAAVLWLFYRRTLREAWAVAGDVPDPGPDASARDMSGFGARRGRKGHGPSGRS